MFWSAQADLHYAVRQVIRRPAWTLVVVLTLALGVGANTAIFTFVDLMLLRPVAWNKGDELVWIGSFQSRRGRVTSVSYPDYLAYRDGATTLSAVLAYGGTALSVGGDRPVRVLGGLVSANYFDVLGIRATIGRTFAAHDDTSGARPVAVLSDSLWREHFGADPRVIDRTVTINGTAFTIAGVAPPGFNGVTSASLAEQLWLPLAMQAVAMPDRVGLLKEANSGWLRVIGRLGNGASLEQADAEMRVVARQLSPVGTAPEREKSARVLPVRGGMTPWEQHDLAPVFGLIAIVPALVLLVACANVANVLMARNLSRRKEFAMRRAIGASRRRLMRLLLTESLVLALLSAAAGFVVSFGLIALIVQSGNVPAEVSGLLVPDLRALVATTAIAMVTTVVFGLAPALTSTKFELLPSLKDEGVTSTVTRGGSRLRGALVVAQVSVSLALLITAALLLQSLTRALRIDPGFDPQGAVAVSFDPDLQGYTASRRGAFVAHLLERASSLPGVTSAAVTSTLPLSGRTSWVAVLPEASAAPIEVTFASVSPRYFETMRVPILRGRDFSAADTSATPLVAVVSATLAERLWPGEDPIGKRVRIEGAKEEWRDVIGVVRDTKYASLTDSPRGGLYLPLQQHPDSPLSLVTRGTGDSVALLSSISVIARSLDGDLPLFEAQTLEAGIRRAGNLRRASASMFAVFGGLTLLLAAIGVFGVSAHSVSRRTREVGIRMSLGARATDVFRMFARESLSLSLIGVAIGLGISLAVSRLLTAFLFGLTSTDAATFAGGSIILGLICAAASYIPARRAAHVDPMIALRHD